MARLDTTCVRAHARGGGAPLLLLHCLGVDRHFWEFAAELAGEFRLLSFDLPGHGETPVPSAPHGIDDLAELTADLLRREGVWRAHVAGISLGSLIAQRLAAAHPELVDRLLLIDTTPRYTDELRNMWAVRAKAARDEGVRSLVDGLLPIWFTPQTIADNTAAVRYVRETLARCAGEGYALACEALANADYAKMRCASARRRWWYAAARTFRAFSMRRFGLRRTSWARRSHGSRARGMCRPEEALQLVRDFLR
jgi:pimeloyl-ACP methyl ester carboxylesterase